VDQVEQSAAVCVLVSVCVCARSVTVDLNDLRLRHLAHWFILRLSTSRLKVKIVGDNRKKKSVAKVVGATSSDGFTVK